MPALARCATAALTCAALAAATLTGPLSQAVATPIAPLPPTAAPGTYSEQNLAADRTPANFFYRIPALAHLGNGVVVSAWDARPGSSADSPNPNSIVQRRSTDGGRTWGPMTTIAAGFAGDATTGKYGYSDPSYVVDHVAGKVFAFFVFSKDVGFAASQFGNDDADRNVISAAVVESTDAGLTWSTPRLITNVVKPGTSKTNPQPGDVRSMFASSGEGIQLRYGAHAGRLVQQYAGYVRQANGTDIIQSWSAYSDDHGATWQKGVPVGTAMDENKTVELSDGRVMLNSRDSSNGHFRKVAISTDGGHSYGARHGGPPAHRPDQQRLHHASLPRCRPGHAARPRSCSSPTPRARRPARTCRRGSPAMTAPRGRDCAACDPVSPPTRPRRASTRDVSASSTRATTPTT